MVSYNQSTIIILTLLISLVCLVSFTYGGDNRKLVTEMCSKTYSPAKCVSCIKGNGQDTNSNVDVIQEMLRCGDEDALKLDSDVNKIINDPNSDPATVASLVTISPFIQNIKEGSGTIHDQVAKREFNDARVSISSSVFQKLDFCNSVLKSSGINIPPVFSGLFNVEADYKLSDQLMASASSA